MRVTITHMRGPRVPQDVISETDVDLKVLRSLPNDKNYATAAMRLAVNLLTPHQIPRDATETRVVIEYGSQS